MGLFGQTAIPSNAVNAKSIAAGTYHSMANVGNEPFVVRHPFDQTAFSGTTPVFTTYVTGLAPLTYQWQFDGTNIAGATDVSLFLTNVQPADAGNYRVVVTNVKDVITSSNAVLTVLHSPPIITNQPNSTMVAPGDTTSLAVGVVGSLPLTHQWRFNQTNIDGATHTSLTLTNVQFSNEGDYDVVVSNDFGVVVSSNAFLNVVDLAEALDATNLVWTTDGDASWFVQTAVTNAGGGVAALQSGSITNNQQSTLQTTVVGPGTLTFWWKVSSEATFDYLSVSVNAVEQSRTSGLVDWRQQTFYLGAGAQTLLWTYAKNGSVSSGQDAGWLDQVNYVPGGTAPIVSTNPANRVVLKGSDVTFSVAALGTLPRVYQWQFNETNIADATTALLTVTNARLASAGSYRVVVGNDYGSTNSSAATLTVLPVVAWGAGTNNTGIQPNYGQSIIPVAASNVVAVAGGGFFSLGLKLNGTITGWGNNSFGPTTIPSSATNVLAIAAGRQHGVALRSNGTVVAWGYNGDGETTVPSAASNVTAVAAGWYHNLARRSNGTVVAWGAGSSYGTSPNLGQSVVPAGLSNVTAVAAGGYHSLALKDDGSVVAWGWNTFGQTNVPVGLSNVVAIAAGASNCVALRRDGTVIGWGDNTFGQTNVPSGLGNVVAVACHGNHVIALKENGTLVVWGDNSYGQTDVPAVATNVIGMTAGRFHSLAILNDGMPAIIRHPSSLITLSGSDALLSVGAAGPGQLTYQWQINGANLEGETNSVLVVSNTQAANTGSYRVIATNDFGAVTSSVASLLVVTPEPIILSQSGNQTVLLRSNVTFNISAVSSLPIDYQWRFNGININGATNISLAVTNAQPTDEGNYSVVLSNAAATVESSNMFLDVIDLADALDTTNLVWTTSGSPQWGPVTNTTHDGIDAASSGGVAYPQQASLQTTVAGPGTLTFWWRALSSLGSMSFSVNGTNQSFFGSGPATWRQMTFYVAAGTHVLRWTCSTAYSFDLITGWLDQVSYVPGTTPAVILTAPMDRSVPAGTNVTFTVSAGGTPPLAYQWQFNGTNLSGVTGASLVLENVQAANAGVYAVIVTNGYGSTNASATLIVDQSAPWIQTHPATKEMVRGGTVTFSSSGRGSEPLSYQWQFNTAEMVGETNATLVLANVQTNHAGIYRAVVTNAYGSVVSSNASLTIVPMVIVAWGNNFFGQCNVPLGLTNVSAIGCGWDFSLAANRGGRVTRWGFSGSSFPSNLTNVIALAGGQSHGTALGNDGAVSTAGSAVTTPSLTKVVGIGAGSFFHSVALQSDGRVIAWGGSVSAQTNVPADLTNVVAIAGGWNHDLAIKNDGTVVAWGYNANGQTNVPSGLSGVVAVAAGWYHSLALREDGTVTAWGLNLWGQANVPAGLDNVVAVSAGADDSIALRNDGTVVAWGGGSSGHTNVPPWLSNVVAIASGQDHHLALLNDGSPYVTRQLWSQTAFSGAMVTFDAVVLGVRPFNFQWQFNGTDIPGATNAVLTLTNLPLTAAGNYRYVVSNPLGATTSQPATLTVLRSSPRFASTHAAIQFTNGGLALQMEGFSGHGDIVIYGSSNLLFWETIFTNPPVLGPFQFFDPTATNYPQRFYRAEER